jgi:hypothetical protein
VTPAIFEPAIAKLMNEPNASLVRLHPHVFDDLVDHVVLAVPKPAHCFELWRIVRTSLGELDAARREKVTNAVEAGLSIHIMPVVRGEIEGTKCFTCPCRTLLKVLVEHLFPTSRVEVGGIRYYAVEIE